MLFTLNQESKSYATPLVNIHSSQLTMCNSFMRTKCRSLSVTSVKSFSIAVAPIKMSKSSMILPDFLNDALIIAKIPVVLGVRSSSCVRSRKNSILLMLFTTWLELYAPNCSSANVIIDIAISFSWHCLIRFITPECCLKNGHKYLYQASSS